MSGSILHTVRRNARWGESKVEVANEDANLEVHSKEPPQANVLRWFHWPVERVTKSISEWMAIDTNFKCWTEISSLDEIAQCGR